ncbi:SPOR domain-containing protein [Polaromonas sp.]|uniref:SPOR domain-containing protein n=1 Tax=Polaromonas sp. TaxID=1869339 RepID=UPI0017B94F8A|nr:SPOR domain-containing protein [Polaromonas sp.]NML86248.1 sporulation protein [Polaromonas sp.]
MKKQRGGTLLGLIIGALVGLGAALAVAVYITKVPVPFMNKIQTRNPDSDAAEARKNKDWNPNAPLAGKNPARAPSASGDVTSTPDSVAPGPLIVPDPVIVKPPKSAASITVPAPATAMVRPPAKPAPSADPLGDLAKARSEASGADPFNYFVQAGAFRTPEDAEQQRARLLLLGMQARVSEREQAGRTVFRVRIGPFDRKDEADRIKERLDNNSIETALVRVQR